MRDSIPCSGEQETNLGCTPYVLLRLAASYPLEHCARQLIYILLQRQRLNVLDYLITILYAQRLADALD